MTAPSPSTDTATVLSPTVRAAFWMAGAILSFLTMAVAGRVLAAELDTFEIMTLRSLTGVIIICIVATATASWHRITMHRFGLQVLRNVAHFTGQNLWFYAITLIPLAQVFALEFTAPLWVLVLSPLFLGERMSKRRALAGLTGFAGILLIARPGFQEITPGLIAAALCAIGFAGTIISTKSLTRDVPTICILFWLTVLQAIFGLVCGGYDMDFALPSPALWPAALLVGFAGLFAHYCVTSALSIAPASVVSPMDFLRLPAAAVVGLLIYGEALDPFVLVGAAIIFAANYANIRGERRA
ncbi:membrane protein, putative [Pseudooceanicola batsensis HTCC2597]|uniref:Membrane protein, putative n=1 Tax=Pseudooceanicola batsensis (strain ATCC BAA-863 / DSM 15984 / KCTC 12145 / HTCC2597) TaxID=252305 RepID=A3TWX9_PSEBH|nr:DMT family transporter [Pseudooceanicola batsensis]EAQ03339.1 membrane protein, putative [Pseudooceanicola batsensis HTCC2597]